MFQRNLLNIIVNPIVSTPYFRHDFGISSKVYRRNEGERASNNIFRLAYLSRARDLSNFTDNGAQAIASGWRDMTL